MHRRRRKTLNKSPTWVDQSTPTKEIIDKIIPVVHESCDLAFVGPRRRLCGVVGSLDLSGVCPKQDCSAEVDRNTMAI